MRNIALMRLVNSRYMLFVIYNKYVWTMCQGREVRRICQNLGKKYKLWQFGMNCTLSDITINLWFHKT